MSIIDKVEVDGTIYDIGVPIDDATTSFDKVWSSQKVSTELSKEIKWSEAATSVKKNLLPNNAISQTKNGVTFTVNSDKSITVNGTASAWIDLLINRPFYLTNGDYIFSIGNANLSTNAVALVYGRANGSWTLLAELNSGEISFTALSTYEYYSIQLGINSGVTVDNVTVYPMIRLATIEDDTYVPYIPDNTELVSYKDNAILGAKNLLPNNATSGTSHGITFTVNRDGTVTASGTATTTPVGYGYTLSSNFHLEVGQRYIISGSPTNTNCAVKISKADNSSLAESTNGNEVEFTYNGETLDSNYAVYCMVRNNATISNLTFKPMIRLATDTDPTYQPYSKTNQQLTQEADGMWDNMMENGAVNMLDHNITTQTKNDATFTVNDDKSITVNCSSSSHNSANVFSTKTVTLPPGTYRWAASKNGQSPIGSNDCYAFIYGINGTNNWYRSYDSAYSWGEFTLTQESTITFGVTIGTDKTVSNLTFYPMICVSSYTGNYVPYAKTNKELTDYITKASTTTITQNGLTVNFVKKGFVVQMTISGGSLTSAISANATMITIPSGYEPLSMYGFNSLSVISSLNRQGRFYAKAEGVIQPSDNLAVGDAVRASATYIAKN